jgi:hypothetical protein
MKRLWPAVVLFFLSPAIAELLSGSAPPVEFFNPFVFVLLTILYGSGAVLARELTIRWRKGWITLLTLGAAYGIIEEGLMVKSFFDPNWVDIGILGSYGRWAGINWVWSIELTIYHAVVSIAIPVLLVGLIFPSRRNDIWIGRKTFIGLSFLLGLDVVFGYLFLTAYRPDAIAYILTVAIAAALVLLSWRLPSQVFTASAFDMKRPIWFWLTGFLGTIAFFLVFWGLPNTSLHPIFTILAGIVLIMLIGLVVIRMSGNGTAWSDMHRFSLAAGPLTLFILFAPIHEFDAGRVDNPAGMTVVGITALLFLLWLWRRVRASQFNSTESGIN